MTEKEGATSRTVVKTYVPAYQRDEWDDHADRLDMSRSEFVRTMVQAGRRGFEGSRPPSQRDQPADGSADGVTTDETVADEETGGAPATPGDLEPTILETLSEDQYRSWDELVAVVTDDIEERLEETLQTLQDAGEIRYSGRNGGYTIDR